MLWEKHFGEEIDVTINAAHEDDAKLIEKNVASNGLKGKILNENPCILLRKETYDFL